MRQALDLERINSLFALLGRRCHEPLDVYLTGGSTAVLQGWRGSTIDVDLKPLPDMDAFLKELPSIKEEFQVNIELASPADFIPELPGWKERSLFIAQHGSLRFYHYDPYSQALSKIERGHAQDMKDVRSAIQSGLVKPRRLMKLFEAIEGRLYRFPAIDPRAFRKAVAGVVERALARESRRKRKA